jgi:hypothetical protein
VSDDPLDVLSLLVTEAIFRAECLARAGSADAGSAYAEVSRYEDALAALHPADDVEGAVARAGAVTAALRAGQYDRARALAARYGADPALSDGRRAEIAASVGALDGVGAAGDLAALARREAGPVMRRQWRACARCGREHWLADGEAVPLHGWVDPWGAAKTCAAVTVGEGSEGR